MLAIMISNVSISYWIFYTVSETGLAAALAVLVVVCSISYFIVTGFVDYLKLTKYSKTNIYLLIYST